MASTAQCNPHTPSPNAWLGFRSLCCTQSQVESKPPSSTLSRSAGRDSRQEMLCQGRLHHVPSSWLPCHRRAPRARSASLLQGPESGLCKIWTLGLPGKQVPLPVTGAQNRGAKGGEGELISRLPFSKPVSFSDQWPGEEFHKHGSSCRGTVEANPTRNH